MFERGSDIGLVGAECPERRVKCIRSSFRRV